VLYDLAYCAIFTFTLVKSFIGLAPDIDGQDVVDNFKFRGCLHIHQKQSQFTVIKNFVAKKLWGRMQWRCFEFELDNYVYL